MTLKNELISSFLLGGTMVMLVTYLVKYLNPEIGAIVWSIPIMLFPTIVVLWNTNVSDKDTPQSVWIAGYKRWRKMMDKANAND